MRILVVEDERRLADALAQILKEQKYQVDAVYTGTDGLFYADTVGYDVIILDVMLPGMTGFEVAEALRRKKNTTPILMLTARSALTDKITGLDAGADDYMTKPFAPEELLARVRALSRRKGEVALDALTFGDVTFTASTMTLACSTGKSIALSFKEGEMFSVLMENREVILSKEKLINKVWGYDSDAVDNNVEAYVSFLRKKLFHIGSRVEIINVKRVGYKLEYKDV